MRVNPLVLFAYKLVTVSAAVIPSYLFAAIYYRILAKTELWVGASVLVIALATAGFLTTGLSWRNTAKPPLQPPKR